MKNLPRFLSLLVFAGTSPAFAAAIVKSAADAELTDTAAWTGGAAPGSSDTATWNSTSLAGAQTVASPVSWSAINFASGTTGTVSLSGSAITLGFTTSGSGDAVANSSGKAVSIANDIILTASFGAAPVVGQGGTNRIQLNAASGSLTLGNVTATGSNMNVWLRGSATTGTVNGALTVDGQLAKGDNGTWILNGANTIGWVYTNNGTMLGGADGAFGAGTIYIADNNGNSSPVIASANATARNFGNAVDLANGSGINFTTTRSAVFGQTSGGTGALTFGALNLGTAVRNITTNADTTFTGTVSGVGGGLKKDGGGTLTLSGNNTYTGPVTVSAGSIVAGSDSALGSGTVTLNTTSASATNRIELNGVTTGASFVLNSTALTGFEGAITARSGYGNSTVNGSILVTAATGNGGHLAAESGVTLTLNGALDVGNGITTIVHRSGTIVYAGGGSTNYQLNVTDTARLGANNGLSQGVIVNLGTSAAGTLDLNGFDQTVRGLSKASGNSATVTNTAGTASTLTLSLSDADRTYSGTIGAGTGGLALAKSGSNAMTLAGTNTYNLGTVVSAGTLVTGNIAALGTGAVTVTGGTLKIGDGTTNTVRLGSGATLAMADGATLAFAAAGGAIDLNGGTATLGSSAGITLDLGNLFNSAGTYNLITGGSVTTNGATTYANFDSANYSAAFSGGTLIVSAVPEPATYGQVGAGALAAVAFVRRRRKRHAAR